MKDLICENKPAKPPIILWIKPYVYEKVNGKRKRSSPFVFDESGTKIIEIKKRAIRSRIQ